MRVFAVIALAASLALPAVSQEIYDLLIKGGHVIDPKNKRNERLDIAISGGRIRMVAKAIPAAHARRVVEASDYYVTPGLIDISAHFDTSASPLSVNPDHNTLRNGVTTAVEAGTVGTKNFASFQAKTIAHSKTRVLAFVNIAGDDPAAAAAVIGKYPETIAGIRATADTMDLALQTAALSKTILLADFPGPLRSGDIRTHIYSRRGLPLEAAREARRKGVLFDVGHGSDGFWFRVAAPAIQQGFLPDTISTGLDKNSLMLPRATMTNVMSKFLAMGLTIEQVIERATANPAKAIRRPDLGSIEEGGIADLAVLELRTGQFGFLDSGHGKLTAARELRCVLTVRNGAVVWDSEGLSLTNWRDAGPYSNFK